MTDIETFDTSELEPADKVQHLVNKLSYQLEVRGVSREETLTGCLSSCIAQARILTGDTLEAIALCGEFFEACEEAEKQHSQILS